MNQAFLDTLAHDTEALHEAGLFKAERVITTPQDAAIRVADGDDAGREVINLCANNYLGLANHPALIEAADALATVGEMMQTLKGVYGEYDGGPEL